MMLTRWALVQCLHHNAFYWNDRALQSLSRRAAANLRRERHLHGADGDISQGTHAVNAASTVRNGARFWLDLLFQVVQKVADIDQAPVLVSTFPSSPVQFLLCIVELLTEP